ncbi:MAG TPA: amidohydrolase [Streptosporangiaceae bacterium]|nr:amidohydrolase [Streptosporangiaceae bacterium]
MSQQAQLVFAGGAVYTADTSRRQMVPATADDGGPASSVAVVGGRIEAIGNAGDSRIQELIGPATEVIDLRGRALLPGFQDAHVHPAFAGVTMIGCNLMGAASLDDALARIAGYAKQHPEREWVAGSGWRMEWFPGGTPDRHTLDRATDGRPAYLSNRDGHGAWANTRALELAGLDARTADPADGRIEREADGGPQGTLHEGAATLVGDLVPQLTFDERLAGLMLAQQHMHARGITAWQDAIVGDYLGSPDPLPVYLAAAASGQLTARVEGALWWDRARDGGQLPDILARRERGRGPRFRANTVKIMQDGVAENFTAGMLEPYHDPTGCHPHGSGLSYVDPVALLGYVTQLDALGFQVHLHAIGDRAVREALNAIEAARTANGWTDNRHHIAHLQVVHPDDVRRFAELDVTANMQGLWAAHEPQMDELTIPFIGPERTARQYVFGDLMRSGARLAAGSDWAVSSANPLRAIHVAVNRSLLGASGAEAEPFLPGQSLELAEALAAYTIGSAYVNHLDDETGTIEPGKLADLVVLDRDPFAAPPSEIGDTGVLATYVQGEPVYLSTSGGAGAAG